MRSGFQYSAFLKFQANPSMPACFLDRKAMKNSYSAFIDQGTTADEFPIQCGYPIRIPIPVVIDANIHLSKKRVNAATKRFRLTLLRQDARFSH
ncbi:MAG TPA: hypothetical protein VI685_21180, partial [Candidatus Angelobacter sp.]